MKTKHTPGPWVCQQYAKCFGIKSESGRQIAIMTEHHGDTPQMPMHQFDRSEQDAADAALIAAAPEMLEALELAANILMNAGQREDRSPNLAIIAKAIRKARGEL